MFYCDLVPIYCTETPRVSSPIQQNIPGLILGLRPASERRRYIVTPFLIG